jgi:hypothetical protein
VKIKFHAAASWLPPGGQAGFERPAQRVVRGRVGRARGPGHDCESWVNSMVTHRRRGEVVAVGAGEPFDDPIVLRAGAGRRWPRWRVGLVEQGGHYPRFDGQGLMARLLSQTSAGAALLQDDLGNFRCG